MIIAVFSDSGNEVCVFLINLNLEELETYALAGTVCLYVISLDLAFSKWEVGELHAVSGEAQWMEMIKYYIGYQKEIT